jgi:hypothetical protein
MTQKTLLLLALLLTLVFSITAVQAQVPSTATQTISPEKLAVIKELLSLTNSKKTIDAMLKAQAEQMDRQMPEIIWQSVSDMDELKKLTTAEREKLRSEVVANWLRARRRTYDLLLEKIDFNKLIEDISVPLHDKYFSESELKDLVVFYKSSTGRKVLDVMPNLVAESIGRSGDEIMPKVAEVISQIQAEEAELMKKELQAKASQTLSKQNRRPKRGRSRH